MTNSNSAEKRSSRTGKTVLIGVGAGIAAYKVAHVVRALRREGVRVLVAPTRDSLHFVGEVTWSELSENPVVTDLFSQDQTGHIALAKSVDLILVAPATADLIAQIREGRASSLLTATILASSAPKLLVPAMHTGMWENPATQDNISTLVQRGFEILPPESGALSSGDLGKGRLPEPDVISDWVLSHMSNGILSGRNVTVTTGGTVEAIDPVRYIANRSTGRQGIEIALAAARLGADVTLVAGNCSVPLPVTNPRIDIVRVESATEMETEVNKTLHAAHALIMTAAVADYRPVDVSAAKLKKTDMGDSPVLSLTQNPDILANICHGSNKPEIVVGFGAETAENFRELGSVKARSKGADYLAVNKVGTNTGFGDVENRLVIFDASGQIVAEHLGDKAALAKDVVGLLVGVWS